MFLFFVTIFYFIFINTPNAQAPSNIIASHPDLIGSQYSSNWAGYILTPQEFGFNKKVEMINGTFTVPQISHSPVATTEYTSVWLGIDGYYNTSDLIQAGVDGVDNNGKVTYFPWYELIPAYSVPINITVKPGDTIYVQITLLNSTTYLWNIYLADLSTGASFSQDVTYHAQLEDAEWVTEAPWSNGVLTLAPFSTVLFNNAHLYVCGFIFCSHYSMSNTTLGLPHILFINQTGTAASPSAIAPNGQSFYVTYTGVLPSPIKTLITFGNYQSPLTTQSWASISAELATNTSGISNQQVNFYANGKLLGNAYTNAQGVASLSFNTSEITPSQADYGTVSIPIYASYLGNQTFNATTSAMAYVYLYERPTNLNVLSDSSPSITDGQQAKVYVQLSSNNNYLQNQIVRLNLNNQIVTGVTNQQGIASFSLNTSDLSPGQYQLYLSYNGSNVYNQSSTSYSLQVLQMATTSIPTTITATTSTVPFMSSTTVQTGFGQGSSSSTTSPTAGTEILTIIIIIVIIVAVIAYLINREKGGQKQIPVQKTKEKVGKSNGEPYQTLRQRYVKGEISEKEYWRMRKELEE